MKELRATVLVGLLVIVATALVVFGVLNTRKGIGDDSETYVVRAMFDDATGIASGTKVTIAGYPVGQVEDVSLRDQLVQVKLRLRNAVKLYSGLPGKRAGELKNAASITRLQASLLGDYYLELAPGAAGTVLKASDEIPIVVSATAMQATLQRLETAAGIIPKIDQIAGDVGKITRNASLVFGSDEGAVRFTEIANNMVAASRDVAALGSDLKERVEIGPLSPGAELDDAVRNIARFSKNAVRFGSVATNLMGALGASAQRSLANVEDVTKTIRDLVGRSTKDVDSTVGTVHSTLRKLEDSLQRIDRVIAHLELITQRTADSEGAVGRLLKDDKLVRDAEDTVAAAKGMLEHYTRLETSIDVRTGYYAGLRDTPSDSRWASQFTLRLSPSKEKAYLITLSGDVDDRVTEIQRNSSMGTAADGSPVVVQSEVRNSVSEFKIGLQYMRRWGPLGLRGGLIESTAGGGVDLYAASDRVQVATDLFRFTEPGIDLPRLRSTLMLRMFPAVYAYIGGDDLLIGARRDVFFGLGLAFTDNDLLLLFASAPSVSVQ